MTAVTVVTVILGYPAAVIPTGEHPFIIKADYLKGMVIAKRKRFI